MNSDEVKRFCNILTYFLIVAVGTEEFALRGFLKLADYHAGGNGLRAVSHFEKQFGMRLLSLTRS